MPKPVRNLATQLLLRFAAVYALVLVLCALFPVYACCESLVAWVTEQTLELTDDAALARSLSFEREGAGGHYVYGVRYRDSENSVELPFHPHAMPLLLLLALVLAAPGIDLRTRVTALVAAGVVMFAVAVGMLMGDIQDWELSGAWAALPAELAGPFGWPVELVRGLHGTAAAALLPVVVWIFLLWGPLRRESEAT